MLMTVIVATVNYDRAVGVTYSLYCLSIKRLGTFPYFAKYCNEFSKFTHKSLQYDVLYKYRYDGRINMR